MTSDLEEYLSRRDPTVCCIEKSQYNFHYSLMDSVESKYKQKYYTQILSLLSFALPISTGSR